MGKVVRDVAKAAAAELSDKGKLVADLEKTLVPLEVIVSDNNFRIALSPEEVRDTSADELIWNRTNDHADGKGEETQDY